MLSKLTSEELKYAKEKINYFSQISFDELNVKVKNEKQPEIYAELSMADSYVLHVISDINYKRNISKLEKEIDVQIKRNDVIRQKSLINSVN
jgi:flagellin-specific chaperone FliS